MNKKISLFLTFFCCAISFLFAENQSDAISTPKFSGWKQAETEHFNFIFEEASRQTVEQYALYADEAWNKIGKIYAFPPEKTDIFVTARTNTVNAYTYSAPSYIVMFTNPAIEPTFTFRENWQKLFFTHELIHNANFHFEDRKVAKIISQLFGPLSVSIDFINVNGWALEGLTTVLETELTDGGRGRSPYFELNYKSLTLDNAFLQYDEIGLDQRPPRGSNYVTGYLIMRSIADNFGEKALADIERNRKFAGSWEKSVQLVTGKSAQDIYADVRIALAKKYADERKIPEGQIISPRETNTSYYKPLIVYDDGTLLSIRSAPHLNAALVKLDPNAKTGRNYLEDTNKDKDLNTVFQETILLNTSFSGIDCGTADINGNVYLSTRKEYLEKNPGLEIEMPLYKWNENEGLKLLTPNVSLFQPSVSRNGKVLLAVQQKGLEMRLVSVNPETGVYKSFLENEKLSFIQPAVNQDGTKAAFLVLNGKKAAVAVADVSNPENYQIVANNDDENIVDPSYPVWNSNGNLTFTCNYRGRLEQFEITVESSNSEIVEKNDSLTVCPVVSDPIGVTWAYQCDKGIIYTSVSSSGNVIKIKPNSEWGKVPDFYGPSMPGKIITLGDLMNDYPDFKPYTQLSEIEAPEIETPEESEKAEKTASPITELQNEKAFIQTPKPLFYGPTVSFFKNYENKNIILGGGAFFIGVTPNLQQNFGVAGATFTYYPEITNFDGTVFILAPSGPFEFGFLLNRMLLTYETPEFCELNTLQLGISFPFINRNSYNSLIDLSFISSITGTYSRYNPTVCSINHQNSEKTEYLVNGNIGLDFAMKKSLPKERTFDFSASAFAYILYDFESNKPFLGAEGDFSFSKSSINQKYNFLVKGRYYPFRENLIINSPDNIYAGEYLDNENPLVLIPQLSSSIPFLENSGIDLKTSVEALIKSGSTQNSDDLSAFLVDDSIGLGMELLYSFGRRYVSFGVYEKLKFLIDDVEFQIPQIKTTIKYDFERF